MSQSLVICSNTRNEGDTLIGGLSAPNSFTNQLSSTIELPSDCQVALSSAKVNMSDLIDLGSGANLFYSYFGTKLPATGSNGILETTATTIPARLTSRAGSTIIGSVGVEGIADRIDVTMNRRIFYPLLKGRSQCLTKYDATGSFEGFNFKYDTSNTIQADIVPANLLALDNSYINFRNNVGGAQNSTSPPRWTYGGGVFTTTAERTNQSKAIYLDAAPISPNLGELEVVIQDVVPNGRGGGFPPCSFGVGLSRGNLFDQGGGEDGNLVGPEWWYGTEIGGVDDGLLTGAGGGGPGFASGTGGQLMPRMLGRCFGDIMVYMDTRPATLNQRGSAGILRVCHMVHDSLADMDGNNTISRWRNIPYGGGGAGFVTANYDIGSSINANTQAYKSVKFKVEGEKVTIVMVSADPSIGEEVLVQYNAAGSKERNIKPISQDCWSMAPILTIDTSFQTNQLLARKLTIQSYICCASNHPSTTHSIKLPDAHSWWLWGKNGADGDGDDASDYDLKVQTLPLRPILDYGSNVAQTPIYIYLGMDNNGGNPRPQGVPAHILSQDAINGLYGNYGTNTTGETGSEGANVQKLFGFPLQDVNDFFTYTGTATLIESSSASLPVLLSTKSMFVRLQNLSNQTINASRSNKSAIISHLPRFDNAGRSSGALFLEPHNLIYVDLNNSNPIKLNSFDISIVYSNETLVDSLTGSTIICLLFRKNPNK